MTVSSKIQKWSDRKNEVRKLKQEEHFTNDSDFLDMIKSPCNFSDTQSDDSSSLESYLDNNQPKITLVLENEPNLSEGQNAYNQSRNQKTKKTIKNNQKCQDQRIARLSSGLLGSSKQQSDHTISSHARRNTLGLQKKKTSNLSNRPLIGSNQGAQPMYTPSSISN